MWKKAIVVIVAAVAPVTAAEGPYEFLGSFPAPPGAVELDWEYEDEAYVLAANGGAWGIYTVRTSDGSVTSSFAVSLPYGGAGLAVQSRSWPNQRYFYVTSPEERVVYKYDEGGSLRERYRFGYGRLADIGYMDYHGFYISVTEDNRIYYLGVNWALFSSFAGPKVPVSSYDDYHAISVYAPYIFTGEGGWFRVVATLPTLPIGMGSQQFVHTDGYTIVAVLGDDGYVYKYRSPWNAVHPSSLGKVKALLR